MWQLQILPSSRQTSIEAAFTRWPQQPWRNCLVALLMVTLRWLFYSHSCHFGINPALPLTSIITALSPSSTLHSEEDIFTQRCLCYRQELFKSCGSLIEGMWDRETCWKGQVCLCSKQLEVSLKTAQKLRQQLELQLKSQPTTRGGGYMLDCCSLHVILLSFLESQLSYEIHILEFCLPKSE